MQNYRLEITVAADCLEKISGFLACHLAAGWEEKTLPAGRARLHVYADRAFLLDLQTRINAYFPQAVCELAVFEEENWLAAWREFFTPVSCGERFVVLPPWLEDTPDFPQRTHILIEPKSAFGTGHHASTALCLTALSELLDAGHLQPGQRFLDLGTGSGILGIACCKSGLVGDGCDTDPLAIENAVENRALNHVATAFDLQIGSIEVAAGKNYDLLVANILARPLIDLAPQIVQACKPGGLVLLSGILASQADSVEAAYAVQGLPKARRFHQGEWCALLWGAQD